jgi:hypothetical protein
MKAIKLLAIFIPLAGILFVGSRIWSIFYTKGETSLNKIKGDGSVLYYNQPETIERGMGAKNMPTTKVSKENGRISLMAHHQNLSGRELTYTIKFSTPVTMKYGFSVDGSPSKAGQEAAIKTLSATPKRIKRLEIEVPHGETISFAGLTEEPIEATVSTGFDEATGDNLYRDAQATLSKNAAVRAIELSPKSTGILSDYGPSEKVLGYGNGQKNKQGLIKGKVAGGFATFTVVTLTNPTAKPVTYNFFTKPGNVYGAPFVYHVDGKNHITNQFSVKLKPKESKILTTFTHGGVDTDRCICYGTAPFKELETKADYFRSVIHIRKGISGFF